MTRKNFLTQAGLGFSILSLALTGCGKKPDAAPAAGGTTPAAETPAAAAKASLTDHAAKLGFAAHLPKETELYLGSMNLKAHLDAAKKTAFWKDVSAFIDDKTPAPSKTANPTGDAAKKLWGDDMFIALAKGATPTLTSIREFSEIYTEITYRAMMAGGPLAGGAPAAAGSQPEKILKAILDDPKLLKRAAATLGGLQIPPMIIGVKAEKPDDLIKDLFPADKLAEISKKAKVTDLTTALGGKFKCLEFQLNSLLTDEVEKQMLAGIPEKPGADDPKAVIVKAIDDVQAKTVSFAYGSAGGYLIIAIGSNASHLQFVDKPDASLLAKPEFEKVLPFAGKDLLMLACSDASVMQAMSSDQPVQPMLRGLISGLKSSEMFRGLAAGLEPRTAEIGEIEKKLFKYTFTSAVAVGWWDQGYHMESFGGRDSPMLDYSKPLQFTSLLDDPGLVFGVNYNAQAEFSNVARTYAENWIELLHHVTGELIKTGLGGPQGGMMFEMIDKTVIPELVNFYRGAKAIDQKALGTEQVLIADLGGKMGALPGLQPDAAEKKILRMAGVHDVVNRALIGTNWTGMEASLKKMIAAVPSPTPIPVPAPLSTEKNGVTTYFYPIPFATEDLLPCASVNDRLFIFGTSKNFNESIAGRLASAKPGTETGLRWKVSFANIREIIKTSASLSKDASAAGGAKTASKWIAPFENMQGRCWNENGQRRDSMTWEIHDVKKFD